MLLDFPCRSIHYILYLPQIAVCNYNTLFLHQIPHRGFYDSYNSWYSVSFSFYFQCIEGMIILAYKPFFNFSRTFFKSVLGFLKLCFTLHQCSFVSISCSLVSAICSSVSTTRSSFILLPALFNGFYFAFFYDFFGNPSLF